MDKALGRLSSAPSAYFFDNSINSGLLISLVPLSAEVLDTPS
jgi:hypothetical protein